MYFEKKKISNPEFFISKKYRQIFFKSKNFYYKKGLLLDMWGVEIAILFHAFLNRSTN